MRFRDPVDNIVGADVDRRMRNLGVSAKKTSAGLQQAKADKDAALLRFGMASQQYRDAEAYYWQVANR